MDTAIAKGILLVTLLIMVVCVLVKRRKFIAKVICCLGFAVLIATLFYSLVCGIIEELSVWIFVGLLCMGTFLLIIYCEPNPDDA